MLLQAIGVLAVLLSIILGQDEMVPAIIQNQEIGQTTIQAAPQRIDGSKQDIRLAVKVKRSQVFDLPAALISSKPVKDTDMDGVIDEYDPHPESAGFLSNVIYEVPYKNKTYIFRLNIQNDFLDIYRHELQHELHENGDNIKDFVLLDDIYIKELVNQARLYASKDKKVNARDLLLNLVKSIPYNQDLYTGKLEYPKYGLETLADHSGDCEDLSILAVNLIGELEGYDKVSFIFFPGHMGVGIKTDSDSIKTLKLKKLPSDHVVWEGTSYLFQEATSPAWQLGQIPKDYSQKKYIVYSIL